MAAPAVDRLFWVEICGALHVSPAEPVIALPFMNQATRVVFLMPQVHQKACPPMSFVAEYTTMSTPCSKGRSSPGPGIVDGLIVQALK
jgi:hypothetical protein